MAEDGGARRPPTTRELMARYGLRAKKSWGQNFLVDSNAQRRIVAAAGLGRDDVVVEIGAGLGALTRHLAEAAGKVIAIERDPELAHVLGTEIAADGSAPVEIAAVDALTFDFAAAAAASARPLVVVGNLPYQITSPLLFGITEAARGGAVIGRAVVMVQKEFAARVVAGPDSDDYGRLSVMVQQQAQVELLFDVAPGCFHPRPAVTSTVMRLVPRREPLAPARDPALFAAVVRAAFSTRRKMLRRALAPAFGEERARGALVAAGIDPTRRGEELAIVDFARLADALAAIDAGGSRA